MSILQQRTIRFGREQYGLVSGVDVLASLPEQLAADNYQCFLLVTDDGVPADIIEVAVAAFGQLAQVHVLTIHNSEKEKNLAVVSSLAEQAIALGCDRRAAVVALGGGMVGNVAGLLAGLLFRGIALIHVPTTFLAASDSVLSLKQAVNLQSGKNLIGLFYTPRIVLVELRFLQRLQPRQIRAGLCELVKNLLAIMPGSIERMRPLLNPLNQYGAQELQQFIDFCIDAKSAVMRDDAHEKRAALALEYGHTVGHALELLADGEFLHGECIAFGMLCAAHIAERRGLLSERELATHHELLQLINVDVRPAVKLLQPLSRALQKDNKRGYRQGQAGHTAMVLLNGLGRLHREAGHYVTLVDNDTILAVLGQLMTREEALA